MVTLKIDNKEIQVESGTTILEAAKQLDINIPTLCYLKEINEIGACRACVVEIKGRNQLSAACNTPCENGMEVFSASPLALSARKMNVSLILSRHNCSCPTCVRNGNCKLQSLAGSLGIVQNDFSAQVPKFNWNEQFPLIRDDSKCINCMRCVQVCSKVQSLNVWGINGTGARTCVGVADGHSIEQAACSLCGQCITHCPTAALRERDDTKEVLAALANPDIITVVQIAPAVRTSWGESFGMPPEEATVEKICGVLKEIGFNYVFDTTFSADLTIMEEGSEFLQYLKTRGSNSLPLFTSCCPGWLRFVKSQYPKLSTCLSSTKSPQQMFGAVTKSWFAEKNGIDPAKIFCVSIMPCIAKKDECRWPNTTASCGQPEVDAVLTTREITRIIRSHCFNPQNIPAAALDSPLGMHSGAGVIFGTTGGVMEAALRTAHYLVTGNNPQPEAFGNVRGVQKGWQEACFSLNGTEVKTAVVNGLGNTRVLMDALLSGSVKYDFVEVMACPGGCVGGGGQPIHDGLEMADTRKKTLYRLDSKNPIRFSHENAAVAQLYSDYLGAPLSEKAHSLLHIHHV